jgi:hypothetical protein
MQLKYFAALTVLAVAYISSVEAAVDPVSLAVIVIAGVAIAKEKLIAAEIHRQYIRPQGSSGYGYKRGKRQVPILRSSVSVFTSPAGQSAILELCAKLIRNNVHFK